MKTIDAIDAVLVTTQKTIGVAREQLAKHRKAYEERMRVPSRD